MSLKQYVPAPAKAALKESILAARYLVSRMAGRETLVPPPWLHSIGDGDFRRTGEEFLGHFREHGRLAPTDRVLDIGSGTGRMALPLTHYLTTGTYDGMDIVKSSIEWCQKAYSGRKNFSFHHSNIFNKLYNPDGTVLSADYEFEFADASFDFIFLTSVFTHMLKEDIENYLAEMRRVLARDGRVLMTAFLLDAETLALIDEGKATFTFRVPLDGCFVEDAAIPERAIAYRETDFRDMTRQAGLSVTKVLPGSWRGKAGLSFQDMVIAERAD